MASGLSERARAPRALKRVVAGGFGVGKTTTFEQRDLPFVVGVNCFDGRRLHSAAEVREAGAVADDVPIELFDARERQSVKEILAVLVECSLRQARAALAAGTDASSAV